MPRLQRPIAIQLLLLLCLLTMLLLILVLLLLLRLHQHKHRALEVQVCFWIRIKCKRCKLLSSTGECGCITCCCRLP
jgi:hypothetical protein